MHLIDQYIKEKSVEIFEKIKGKKIIYLDLNYWILVRDKRTGEDTIAAQIANKIISLHETGRCIFPLSEMVFWEIMKQSDEKTRNATLILSEKLSEGIAIIGEDQRIKVEFSHWVQSSQKVTNLYQLKQLIWAKLPLVTGYFFYSEKVKELEPELRRSLLDFAGSIPLSTIPVDPQFVFEPFTGKDDVKTMNVNKEIYKDENKSFNSMFLSELWGCLECYKDDFNTVINDLYFEQAGRYPTAEEVHQSDQTAWCKLIYQAFKSGKLTNQLPVFKIFPSLFASMRWNIDRKYKDGNDTADVKHATCALPYCDYLFTEKELHTMIKQTKLDETFNCIVESHLTKVLEILNSI